MSTSDNKRYYWLKLKQDFFSKETVDFLMSQSNGCEYVVLYQMLCLQTINNNGVLATQIGEVIVPYDVAKIVRDTKYFSEDTVMVALNLYKSLGLIYEQSDGVLKIVGIENMVGSASSNHEAIKKAEYRQRKKETNGTLEGTSEWTKCPTEYRDKRLELRENRELNIKENKNTNIIKNENEILKEERLKETNKDNNIKKNKNNIKKEKIKYAEFVSLTEEEFKKLNETYGEGVTQELIEKLNNYKGASGRPYKSDYYALRGWVIKSYREEHVYNHRKQSNEKSTQEIVDEIMAEYGGKSNERENITIDCRVV